MTMQKEEKSLLITSTRCTESTAESKETALNIINVARNAAIDNLNTIREDLNVVYVYVPDISDNRNIYKVGWSSDVWRREKDYSTITPEGRMVFYIACKDARQVEKVIKTVLQEQFRMRGEVVYGIPFDMLKNLMISAASSQMLTHSPQSTHSTHSPEKLLPVSTSRQILSSSPYESSHCKLTPWKLTPYKSPYFTNPPCPSRQRVTKK